MIIKKIALLMLTLFLVSANTGERSKQNEQIRTTTGAEIGGVIVGKVGFSDGNTQGAGLSGIKRSWETLE